MTRLHFTTIHFTHNIIRAFGLCQGGPRSGSAWGLVQPWHIPRVQFRKQNFYYDIHAVIKLLTYGTWPTSFQWELLHETNGGNRQLLLYISMEIFTKAFQDCIKTYPWEVRECYTLKSCISWERQAVIDRLRIEALHRKLVMKYCMVWGIENWQICRILRLWEYSPWDMCMRVVGAHLGSLVT